MKSPEELAREFDNVNFIEFIKNIQRNLHNMAINDEINRLQSIIFKQIGRRKKDSTTKIKLNNMSDKKFKELERAFLAGWNEIHKCNNTISLEIRKTKFKIWYDKKLKN